MTKQRIIETLGEGELLVPELVRDAIAANDRVKYLLTLLQTAEAAADGGDELTLREERVAAGVEGSALDRVVSESSRHDDGTLFIPNAESLTQRAFSEVDTMLAPLRAAGVDVAEPLDQRLDSLAAAIKPSGSMIDRETILRLTAGRGGGDTLHLVVMDAHRELNRLEAALATESLDGAMVHDLAESDRPLVRAFMRGLASTERLRLDHPGLGTVATRSADALVIQNDIGETDAHVVVIRVVDGVTTVTYTDNHLDRLLFFQRLFEPRDVSWDDTRSRSDARMEDGLYHLAVGRHDAETPTDTAEFLAFLGSRLVFLIDWNRARKRLRNLVGNKAAVELLGWAADNGYGHMAFLRACGERLVYDALDFATGSRAQARKALSEEIGSEEAADYLRTVLRTCADGILGGLDLALIQDEVRAELTGYLSTPRQRLLRLVVEHAESVVEIAESARDALESGALPGTERRETAARSAREREHRADALVNRVRAEAPRADDPAPFLELVEAADDAADGIEDAAYHSGLLPEGRPVGQVRALTRRMASLVLDAARNYLRAVILGREASRAGSREDTNAFLESVHRVVSLEREVDEVERSVHAALMTEVEAAGELFVLAEATRMLEQGVDSLMHASMLLRDLVLAAIVGAEPTAVAAGTAPTRSATSALAPDLHLVGGAAADAPMPDAAAIGAKAHGLARMATAGLRVPEAVVIGTAVSRHQLAGGDLGDIEGLLAGAIAALEFRTDLGFGAARRPLLLSVRSGAPVSMPGMLETVLDIGVCDRTVEGLIAMTGNPRLAWDSYRRLVESFAHVVADCPPEPFARATERQVAAAGVAGPRDLDADTLAELTRQHLACFAELADRPFPQDPNEQLSAAVRAVLDSWRAPKAREYRRLKDLSENLGTAVILQRMVFGNAGGVSGSGVAFTRNPATGERGLYIDFLLEAQGEDVVAGRHAVEGADELEILAPSLLARIAAVCPTLEAEFGDAQEFELTIEDGELYLLQSRTAKRTAWAALRIAVDQVGEGLITPQAGLERVARLDLAGVRRVRVRGVGPDDAIGRGIPASVGVASGPIALDAEMAERFDRQHTSPVLVRADAATEDISSMAVAAGVLTAAGGRTSHAAVVARELGKPCLVGCTDLEMDLDAREVRIGDRRLAEGDVICLDAESGLIFAGSPALESERPDEALEELAEWKRAAGSDRSRTTEERHGLMPARP